MTPGLSSLRSELGICLRNIHCRIVALSWLVYAREGGGERHDGLGIRIRGDRRTIEKDGIGEWGDWGNIYREMGSLTLTRARNLVIRAKSRMVYDSN